MRTTRHPGALLVLVGLVTVVTVPAAADSSGVPTFQAGVEAINLNVTAVHGAVLGDLFCALAHAKVTFPRAASAAHALNSRLHGRPLRVFAAAEGPWTDRKNLYGRQLLVPAAPVEDDRRLEGAGLYREVE